MENNKFIVKTRTINRIRKIEKKKKMLLAVGGESRRIVLGEVPPARTEQEQEPAQDVAAQWLQHEDTPQEKNRDSTINLSKPKIPVPQPRSRIGKPEEAKSRGIRNRKSRRRRIKGTGNRSSSYISHHSCK